jgi:hypothetical protein
MCCKTRFVQKFRLKGHELIARTPSFHQVDVFISAMKSYIGSGTSVNLHHGLRAVTLDIITAYCFGQSTSSLDAPGFEHPFIMQIPGYLAAQWNSRRLPFVQMILRYIPNQVAHALIPSARPTLRILEDLQKQVDSFIEHPEKLRDVEHEIIFTHLLRPDQKHVPSRLSLLQEVSRKNVIILHDLSDGNI